MNFLSKITNYVQYPVITYFFFFDNTFHAGENNLSVGTEVAGIAKYILACLDKRGKYFSYLATIVMDLNSDLF